MDRAKAIGLILSICLLSGCGGSREISPATGFDDCVQIGDTIYTVDGEFDAGGVDNACDRYRHRAKSPTPLGT